MKIKTMRNIPTLMGRGGRVRRGSREQTVNTMARLEHEKARLERELAVWAANQQRTAEQLRRVEEQLALAQQALGKPGSDAALRAGSHTPGAKTERRDQTEEWPSISLEY